MVISPLNELEAVNVMLGSIGESPVNKITAGLSEANLAKTVLLQTSRQVQTRGWYFNTEIITVAPDTEGHLYLPRNTLKVDSGFEHIVIRGQRLYNRYNNTFVFDGSIKVGVVLGLGFDELPEVARNYITIRSARIFQDRTVGSTNLRGFTQQDEIEARVMLEETETENGNYNIFDNRELRGMLKRTASSMPYRGSSSLTLEDMVRGGY